MGGVGHSHVGCDGVCGVDPCVPCCWLSWSCVTDFWFLFVIGAVSEFKILCSPFELFEVGSEPVGEP